MLGGKAAQYTTPDRTEVAVNRADRTIVLRVTAADTEPTMGAAALSVGEAV